MIGGQQDRVIGQEVVVEATSKPTTVPVFCVEHHRWSQRDVAQNVDYLANVQAHDKEQLSGEELQKLAQEANSGKFVKGAGVVTKDVRLAVQSAMDQNKVWDESPKRTARTGPTRLAAPSRQTTAKRKLPKSSIRISMRWSSSVAEKPQRRRRDRSRGRQSRTRSTSSNRPPLFQKLWPRLLKKLRAGCDRQRPDRRRQDLRHGPRRSISSSKHPKPTWPTSMTSRREPDPSRERQTGLLHRVQTCLRE